MYDVQVFTTQVWLNQTYGAVPGFVRVAEDGETGWRTVWALRRALQHELGITALSDAFGPATTAAFVAQIGELGPATRRADVVRILQGGLWCKGYTGGYGRDGVWDDTITASVARLATDMGLPLREAVDVTMMKGVLSMDAYVLVTRGTPAVRAAQQLLNRTYSGRRDYTLVPCDGVYSRDVNKGLVLGLQYELGMADGVANGTFGPATQEALAARGTVRLGDTDTTRRFVQLFQCALACNGYDVAVGGTFDGPTRDAVEAFQTFACLPVTRAGDYATWASLLVSTGDPKRDGTAADTNVPLLGQRAATLAGLGYTTVGRYLTGKEKHLRAGEIEAIHTAGMALVPIYQEWNNAPEHFSRAQGRAQGVAAVRRARQLGIAAGAVLYFPVDFDATDNDVSAVVLPYFRGVREGVSAAVEDEYRVGVYGPRNVCARVTAAGLAELPFVAGLSRAWSGNQGYPLPPGWAYDQVATRSTTGWDAFSYDNDIQSPRAVPVRPDGVRPVPTRTVDGVLRFRHLHMRLTALRHWAQECVRGTLVDGVASAGNPDDFVLHHLAQPAYGPGWAAYAPLAEAAEGAASATAMSRGVFTGAAATVETIDTTLAPAGGDGDVARWASVCRAALVHVDDGPAGTCRPGDLAGWALDLALLWARYTHVRDADAGVRVGEWFAGAIGGDGPAFTRDDWAADLDGYVVASLVRADGLPVDVAAGRVMIETAKDAAWSRRQFAGRRFGGDRVAVEDAVRNLFTALPPELPGLVPASRTYDPLRLPGQAHDAPTTPAQPELDEELTLVARAFADALLRP